MFSHIMVGSNDLTRSKHFYDRLLNMSAIVDDRGRLAYRRNSGLFMVSKPIDGKPASHANGGTIGFALDSPAEVDAWYQAGVAAGGTPIEDAPGWRSTSFGDYYLAYLRDPDGNKLCGHYRAK